MFGSLFRQCREVFRSVWPQPAVRLNKKAARLRAEGKLAEAMALLDRAIRLDRRMAEAYVNRCYCYCDLHKYAKAIEDANQAIDFAPEMARAFRARAYPACRLGQSESAVADLNEALRLEPENPEIYYERGAARGAAGDYRGGITDSDRLLKERPEAAFGCLALTDIDEAVRLDPKNGRFPYIRAGILWMLGRLEEAFSDYEAALGLVSGGEEEWRNQAMVNQKMLGGTIALKQGNYREAIEQFDGALEIIEGCDFCRIHGSARLYYDRGVAWHSLGECENALRDMNEAARREPQGYLYFLADLLYQLDRIEEASAAYEAALEENPELKKEASPVWLGGAIALKQGNYWEAIAQFDAALEADSTSARVHNDRGEAWIRLREYERALRDFDKAIALEPDHAIYYINRASALMRLLRYADANRDLLAARRCGPDNAYAYCYLAWFRATCPEPEFRNGRQAVAMAHKAIELAGERPKWNLQALAAAYAECGDFNEAIRWQTEVLANAPEEERPWYEVILENYRTGIPRRMRRAESEDFEL